MNNDIANTGIDGKLKAPKLKKWQQYTEDDWRAMGVAPELLAFVPKSRKAGVDSVRRVTVLPLDQEGQRLVDLQPRNPDGSPRFRKRVKQEALRVPVESYYGGGIYS